VILTLPLCPTDNNRLKQGTISARTGNRMFRPSEALLDWQPLAQRAWDDFQDNLKEQGLRWEIEDPTYERQHTYLYRIYLKNLKPDFSNYGKVIKDFLKGKVWVSDKYVNLSVVMPVLLDRENGRIEIDLKPIVHHVEPEAKKPKKLL
jgi:Endodeoxyribonuclease RusA